MNPLKWTIEWVVVLVWLEVGTSEHESLVTEDKVQILRGSLLG